MNDPKIGLLEQTWSKSLVVCGTLSTPDIGTVVTGIAFHAQHITLN